MFARMTARPRPSRAITFVIAAVIFLIFWDALLFQRDSSLSDGLSRLFFGHRVEVEALPGLASLCRSTSWTPNVWLKCLAGCGPDRRSFCGGLTNARNRIALCMRQAIDVGATGVFIPGVSTRDPNNPTDTNHGTVCPGEYWDTEHLRKTMAMHCPMLQLRFCENETQFGDVAGPVEILAPAIRQSDITPVRYYTGDVRAAVDALYPGKLHGVMSTGDSHLVVIETADPIYSWDWLRSNETSTIRRELFKILQYKPELKLTAHQILEQSEQLRGNAFIAVHLRGESDWPAVWGPLNEQINAYTAHIGALRGREDAVSDVYVSCGDQNAIRTFRARVDALELGYRVHDKWSLLSSNSNDDIKNRLDGLGFDHLGAVEYEIMVRARFFVGISTSTMSLLVAYARTVDADGQELGSKPDFWEREIYPNTTLTKGEWSKMRDYRVDNRKVRGDDHTSLMVVSGPDMMEYFP